jgi:hypothetical protein
MNANTLTAIVAEYAPYDTMEAFGEGDDQRRQGASLGPWP